MKDEEYKVTPEGQTGEGKAEVPSDSKMEHKDKTYASTDQAALKYLFGGLAYWLFGKKPLA